MIQGMFNSGAMPVLERMIQFTEARHRVLTDNIANLSTPYFKPRDLSVQSFQATLRQAIEQRRASADPQAGPLPVQDTRQLRFRGDGLDAAPDHSNQNILFHDQNNRDVERLMQHLAENTLAHRMSVELMRGEMQMLQTAIRERV